MPVKSLIYYIRNFLTTGHERTLRAKKNVLISFITKGFSIIISFLIVPLTLNYVSKAEYGVWMTVSAIIQWFTFFDIGLGNGLRNKLAEALASNDLKSARIYVSSVFAIILGVTIFIFIAFLIGANFISWNKALNTTIVSNESLRTIVIMVFFFFCIGFILNLTSSVLAAMQRYSMINILALLAQLLGLVALWILVKTTKGSLFNLCLVYGSKTAIVMLIATIILFAHSLKDFRPSIKFVQIKQALPLIKLGVKFFLTQILYLIVNQTSIILVAHFFGSEDVTVFNLAVKYISITSMVYVMVLTPFLSAFTEAYSKKEFDWIKNAISRINKIWLLTTITTIIMVFFYKIFFQLWVGNQITVPFILIIALAVFGILNTWSSTYSLFLNGIGIIKLQLYILIGQAILFVPLSYLFFRLGFGLTSIVVVQIIFYSVTAILNTLQYKKIIAHKAKGIWIK